MRIELRQHQIQVEIEQLLTGTPGPRPGCAVALASDVEGGGEPLIVLAERDAASRPEAELVADINARILNGVALVPHDTCLLAAGTLRLAWSRFWLRRLARHTSPSDRAGSA